MNRLQQSLQLLIEKMQGWLDELILGLPNLILAMVVVVLFLYVGRGVKKVCYSALDRVTKNTVISGLLASMIGFLVFGAGIFFGLEILKLSKVVTSLLAGAGIVGLAMGIAFQDFVSNIISGIFLAIRKPLHVGDVIDTSGHFGTVKEMGLRSTIIEKPQGQYVYIPNREIFQQPLVNYSKKKMRRVDLQLGVSYNDELENVRAIALKAIQSVPELLENKPVELYFEAFGDSSINFVLRFWIKFKQQKEYKHAVSEAIITIKKAFDKEKVSIPFPIRTLDMDTKQLKKVFGRK